MTISNYLGYSIYDRNGLDKQLKLAFEDSTWNDITVNDLLITAYSYNFKKPRFYSKYFLKLNPGIYSLLIREAVAGSASAPWAFNPKIITDKLGLTEYLVDGGLIANSPALYAYDIAKSLENRNNLKVMSLGSGSRPDKFEGGSNGQKLNSYDELYFLEAFVFELDTAVSNLNLKEAL